MRPVLAADLICAGRAVLAALPEDRPDMARRLLDNAAKADLFREGSGVRHPEFGDGTLAAAARCAGLEAEPTICDPDFAGALILVLHALIFRARGD